MNYPYNNKKIKRLINTAIFSMNSAIFSMNSAIFSMNSAIFSSYSVQDLDIIANNNIIN